MTNTVWSKVTPTTFGFMQVAPTYASDDPRYSGFSPFTDQQIAMARQAISLWGDVADIPFLELRSSSAKIGFANSSTLDGSVAGHAYSPGSSNWSGDVWINSAVNFNINPEIGDRGFYVLVHEIGHAIGLEHPGDYEASDGPVDFHTHAGSAEDTFQYSIMSYFSESYSGADFGGFFAQSPMLNDIAEIQALYSANMSTRTGDTIYDFAGNPAPVLSIWDAGGTDTIDVSSFHQNAVVNLIAGEFSNVAGLVKNLSIAHGAMIENAVTGSGDDTITGNAGDNIVDGGTGIDTFMLSAFETDVQLIKLDTGLTLLNSALGTDQLAGIETIEFSTSAIEVANQIENSILEYGASHFDLAEAFGANKTQLLDHLLTLGLDEGRSIDFSALAYISVNPDLQLAFGQDVEAGARHYIDHGRFENRSVGPESVHLVGVEAGDFLTA
ncbi:MAG: M10 family metallopeptidase C-terminal domain-containing protein [Roseibium sp.]